MFNLSHLPGTSLSFGISRREQSITVREKGQQGSESDQPTELGRLVGLHTGQEKMVSKLYEVNVRKIVLLLPVQCHFRIGDLF